MRARRGFTLIELLVVIAIISLLATLVTVNWPTWRSMTQRTAGLNNMRAIGIALRLYCADNDNMLPKRVAKASDPSNPDDNSGDKWPTLLAAYLDDVKVYAAPGDKTNYIFRQVDPLSNSPNNTSYIMNGYNDVGAFEDENVGVRLNQIEKLSEVILLGTPKSGSRQFYMDMLEGKGNHYSALDLELYNGGSNYLFADGSARYIKKDDYDHRLWLVNKDFPVP